MYANQSTSPWQWIPTLYIAQALPYVMVMSLSVVMYKNLGLSNTDIALYTSWLYLPWVIKPLWSPLIEIIGAPRRWIWVMQLIVGVTLGLVAFTLPGDDFIRASLAILWIMAFCSATHDIAADGFYLAALPSHQQAAFVGVRSTFYRMGNIFGQGLLVFIVGKLIEQTGNPKQAWMALLIGLASLFILFGILHRWTLPTANNANTENLGDQSSAGQTLDQRSIDKSMAALEASPPKPSLSNAFKTFGETFVSFFKKPEIVIILAFLLLFRFGEAQALKLVTPFLLDPVSKGGLGLTTAQVGIAYGTVGVAALTLGGLLGGWVISKKGLKYWLWPMIFAVHLPNILFVYMAINQPQSLWLVSGLLAVEQFGYGFGFCAYLLYMIKVAEGPFKTAHYSICTGLMAAGMMIPGLFSGWLQTKLGYTQFFIWVCVATLPSVFVAFFVKIDPKFGTQQGV
jgi:MFS transporter, PAT family, beta-lactamase induction signal transducer AmpG